MNIKSVKITSPYDHIKFRPNSSIVVENRLDYILSNFEENLQNEIFQVYSTAKEIEDEFADSRKVMQLSTIIEQNYEGRSLFKDQFFGMFYSLDKYFKIINVGKPIYIIFLVILMGVIFYLNWWILQHQYFHKHKFGLFQFFDKDTNQQINKIHISIQKIKFRKFMSQTTQRIKRRKFTKTKNIKKKTKNDKKKLFCKLDVLDISSFINISLKRLIIPFSLALIIVIFIILLLFTYAFSSSVFFSFCATFAGSLPNDEQLNSDYNPFLFKNKIFKIANSLIKRKQTKLNKDRSDINVHSHNSLFFETEKSFVTLSNEMLLKLNEIQLLIDQFVLRNKLDVENIDSLIFDINKQVACSNIEFVYRSSDCSHILSNVSKTVKHVKVNRFDCIELSKDSIVEIQFSDCVKNPQLILTQINELVDFFKIDFEYLQNYNKQVLNLKNLLSNYLAEFEVEFDSLTQMSLKLNDMQSSLISFYEITSGQVFHYPGML